ncbi:hypothetical protein [Streptomyces sp. NRRL B-3229]|uniref:hypothetical protein n=1 Tax=Streptomyces sp. NRRL B-3229 TaxID=1463836 RepID=UPI00131B6BCC|nr:hypothetical protein [Streptomyces sp. NRRL B-3229]
MNRVFRVGAVIQISITAVESKVDTALTASYARITDATPEAAIERKEAGAEKTGVNRFINDNLGHSAQCTADPTCMDQGVGAALSGRNADPHDSARRNIRASTL